MSLYAILLGGDCHPTPRLAAQIAGARIIAADSGIVHAAALGIVPELWIGDFDSIDPDGDPRWAGIPRMEFPRDKSESDGEIAANEAIRRGARRLVLAGAFGGPRSDHAVLHMTAALRLAERGVPALLSSGVEEGLAILPGTTRPALPAGSLFSVMAFSDLAGLTITGARWPLRGRDVPFGSSLTLSNVAGADLQITLDAGRAMLVARPAGAV